MAWVSFMPNRIIRSGINSSEKVNLLDWPEEVFYRRLLNAVDDHGLFDARPSILRATLYPLRVDRVREADISRWLAACEKAGLILLYCAAEKPYLQITNTQWKSRSEPKYPLPPTSSGNCLQLRAIASSRTQLRPYSETETESETNSETETETETGKFPAAAGQVEIQIQSLKTQLQTLYNLNGASWQLDGQLSTLAIELHALKATAADLQAFWAYRRKKPALQYFHQDFLSWRATSGSAPSSDGQSAADDRARRIADAQQALAEMEARSVRQRSAGVS